jgi:hypothetical protein
MTICSGPWSCGEARIGAGQLELPVCDVKAASDRDCKSRCALLNVRTLKIQCFDAVYTGLIVWWGT